MIIENKFETRYLLKLCKMKMKMKMKSWKLLMVRCTSPGSCLCIDLPSPGLLTDRLLTEKNECTYERRIIRKDSIPIENLTLRF